MTGPKTETELLERAWHLAGRNLAEIASALNQPIPPNLKSNKGWVGHTIEQALGSAPNNLPFPDFQHLGIELKTIPVNAQGNPQESTYVCTVELSNLHQINWHNSHVKRKLNKVLWIPILSDKKLAPAERIVGAPILWQPNAQQEADLQQDWQEFAELIVEGRVNEISSRLGEVLQIRPKGANAQETQTIIDPNGTCTTMRRGFYLRTQFTQAILNQHFH